MTAFDLVAIWVGRVFTVAVLAGCALIFAAVVADWLRRRRDVQAARGNRRPLPPSALDEIDRLESLFNHPAYKQRRRVK